MWNPNQDIRNAHSVANHGMATIDLLEPAWIYSD